MGEGKKEKVKTQSRIIREFSSGGVVYRRFKIVKWLITKSTASVLYPKQVWRLPKGWIDNESENIPGPVSSGKVKATEQELQKTALREVSEEGGVVGKIEQKIGTTKYFYNTPDRGKILKFVTFYLMRWIRDLPEGFDKETSEIEWLTFAEAYKKLSFSSEKQVLKKASGLVQY